VAGELQSKVIVMQERSRRCRVYELAVQRVLHRVKAVLQERGRMQRQIERNQKTACGQREGNQPRSLQDPPVQTIQRVNQQPEKVWVRVAVFWRYKCYRK